LTSRREQALPVPGIPMTLKPAVRFRIIASFVLAATVLAAAATILYRNAGQTREIRHLSQHTRAVIEELQGLMSTVQDAETGQRGYLLTGDEDYLAPYNSAVSHIDASLERLERLSAHDTEQLARVRILQRHVHAKFGELGTTIRLRRRQGLEAARQMVLAGNGEREMEVISGLITNMEEEQNQLLEQHRRAFEANLNRTTGLLALAIAIQFALLTLVFILFYRDTAHRQYATSELEHANSRMRTILTTMGDGLYRLDSEGKLAYLNPAGERLLGYKLTDIRGRVMHTLVHSRKPTGEINPLETCPVTASLLEGTNTIVPQDWFERSDGSFIAVEYSSTPLIQEGEIAGVVVCFRDINERLQREEELRATTQLQHAILQSANSIIISTRADGIITTFNAAAEEMLQYSAQDVVGKLTAEMLHDPEEVATRAAQMSKELGVPVAPGREVFTRKTELGMAENGEWSYIRRDGTRFPVSLSIAGLRDAAGKITGFMGIAEDITERKKAEAALRESEARLKLALEREKDDARIDFLTRIPNRRAFYEIAAAEATRARRYKRPLTIAYLDLDNFKNVNDSSGHEVGDELLVEVAATIRSNLRSTDTVARLGGDEFAMLLPETSPASGAMVIHKLFEKLQASIRQKDWPVTCSIGVVSFEHPPESVDDMVRQADEAMYSAKVQGKNSVAVRGPARVASS